jgi:predicted DCC family thiol-disulfide oxidoreductase YuxK
MIAPRKQPVLLYDGECALCASFVRFIIWIDRDARLHFGTLQGEAAQRYLKEQQVPADADSLVFIPDWNHPEARDWLLRTSGALATLHEIGGVWGSFYVLRHIPRFLRDSLYRVVAWLRYAFFGTTLRHPSRDPRWRRRFIDTWPTQGS